MIRRVKARKPGNLTGTAASGSDEAAQANTRPERSRDSRILKGVGGLMGIVLAAALGFFTPLVWNHLTGPPSDRTVVQLMDREVVASRSHDAGVVEQIYAADATVTDAGCLTVDASRTWHGVADIQARYVGLPEFVSLGHVNTHVIWEPADRHANRAEATADTNGVIAPNGTSPNGQPINGHELWTFVRSGNGWVIQSFTYNLCFPQ